LIKPHISIFGLGAGSGDDITLGTIKGLKRLKALEKPLLLRTNRHPSVEALAADGVSFDGSFDDVYEQSSTFDVAYAEIVDRLIAAAAEHQEVGYAVPGHPLFGERTVRLLLDRSDQVDVSLHSSTSFIDACLSATRHECSGLVVIDGLTVPDPTDLFSCMVSPVNRALPNLIYQVYDTHVAGRVKIALLERYPPEFEVFVIRNAGIIGQELVAPTLLSLLDHPSNYFDHLTSVLVPVATSPDTAGEFLTLCDIMARLRHPTKGCPWDREQTPFTLKRYAVEEVYELVDAIDEGNIDHYVEELGDLLLQVVFHAQLAKEACEFTIEDVILSISEKLIRRHPHVFGEMSVADSSEVLVNWEAIKKSEKGNEHRSSRLDGVPNQLPALSRALDISKRAAKAGFEWPSVDEVFTKLDEEILELKEALASTDPDHIRDELGDLLFTAVNLGRFAKVDAEDALRRMVRRFETRFKLMELSADKPLEELSESEFERLWRAAKREQSDSG
jgi:tetrapyrrole methylase family protein / MazG family protein